MQRAGCLLTGFCAVVWLVDWLLTPGFATPASPEDVTVAASAATPEEVAPTKTALANAPLSLIIEPSRELAMQTYDVLVKLSEHVTPKIRVVLLMGGGDTRKAQQALRNGCDVVVATPGVLTAFVKSNKINLSCVRVFVLDEADHMCDPEKSVCRRDCFSLSLSLSSSLRSCDPSLSPCPALCLSSCAQLGHAHESVRQAAEGRRCGGLSVAGVLLLRDAAFARNQQAGASVVLPPDVGGLEGT